MSELLSFSSEQGTGISQPVFIAPWKVFNIVCIYIYIYGRAYAFEVLCFIHTIVNREANEYSVIRFSRRAK